LGLGTKPNLFCL